MVMMDEQALEAQGVVARRKMFKTFEVVRRYMDIIDPTAPPPPPPPPGALAPGSACIKAHMGSGGIGAFPFLSFSSYESRGHSHPPGDIRKRPTTREFPFLRRISPFRRQVTLKCV